MKKCFELTPCLLAFLCITSCVEDVENERLRECSQHHKVDSPPLKFTI